MSCSDCGSENTTEQQKEETVPVPVITCSTCNMIFTREEAEKIKTNALSKFLGLLTPLEITQIREQLHLSIDELAVKLGANSSFVHRWESGLSLIPSRLQHKLLQLKSEEK